MRWATIGRGGSLVEADDAKRRFDYFCPSCGGRAFLRPGAVREAHFAHHPGAGTPDCENYFPWAGSYSPNSAPVAVRERRQDVLPLVVDGEEDWSLALRLACIPAAEFGDARLSDLQSGAIEVFVGEQRTRGVSGVEVRPGAHMASALVVPSASEYRITPAGRWPKAVDVTRWSATARGLNRLGTVFRLRGGEWTRLSKFDLARGGERLVIVANELCQPPRECAPSRAYVRDTSNGRWALWRVTLPRHPSEAVAAWLGNLGHDLGAPKWRLTLLSVPSSYAEDGAPRFLVGENVFVAVLAPSPAATASLQLRFGHTETESIVAPAGLEQIVAIKASVGGPAVVTLATEGCPHVKFAFVEQTTLAQLRESLRTSPRLRLWIDERCFEPWAHQPPFKRYRAAVPHVRVDTGAADLSVSVVVAGVGAQKVSSRLRSADAAGRVAAALIDPASRSVEVDAGPLRSIRIEVEDLRATGELAPDRRAGWIRNCATTRSDRRASGAFVRRALVSTPMLTGPALVGVIGGAAAQLRVVARRLPGSGGHR